VTVSSIAPRRHRVVIIGSGFGGLFAAKQLKRADVDVTLIAKTTHHLFQPLLYQVATGILSVGEIAPATRMILRKQKNAEVLLGEVVAIDLQKRIPMHAGLGGGSSDAAAALRVFARMWRVEEARARAIGRELGADVPYFFEGGTVLGLERGDLLFPLIDRPPAWVVLVFPSFGVSTKEAFAWWDACRSLERLALTPNRLLNDLEAVVSKRHPEIARIVTRLRNAGASQAAMSGSGSTVFGLFGSQATAARAARALRARSRQVQVTTLLNRARYQRLAAI